MGHTKKKYLKKLNFFILNTYYGLRFIGVGFENYSERRLSTCWEEQCLFNVIGNPLNPFNPPNLVYLA
jgi:hypothetical protein